MELSSSEWKKNMQMQIAIRFSNTSDIAEALRKMQEETGILAATFTREAIREKLVRDGYLADK